MVAVNRLGSGGHNFRGCGKTPKSATGPLKGHGWEEVAEKRLASTTGVFLLCGLTEELAEKLWALEF
jgi:hypothetical protein